MPAFFRVPENVGNFSASIFKEVITKSLTG